MHIIDEGVVINFIYNYNIIDDDDDDWRSSPWIKPKNQKTSWRVRAKDHGSRGHGAKPSKKGGPGGVPKIAKFCTRGGKFGGGLFWGGPGTWPHKTWSFMDRLNIKFNLIVEDDHHRWWLSIIMMMMIDRSYVYKSLSSIKFYNVR